MKYNIYLKSWSYKLWVYVQKEKILEKCFESTSLQKW